jgi:hypothetical protein
MIAVTPAHSINSKTKIYESKRRMRFWIACRHEDIVRIYVTVVSQRCNLRHGRRELCDESPCKPACLIDL